MRLSDGIDYECAIGAVDDLLAHVFGGVAKGSKDLALDPLRAKDFDILVERIAKRLRSVTAASEDRAVASALAELDLDWANVNAGRINAAIYAARQSLMRVPDHVMDAVDGTFKARAPEIVRGTRVGARRQFGLKIDASLSLVDKRVVEFTRSSATLFVRDAYGRRNDTVDARVRGLVASGLRDGLGNDDIASKIASTITTGPAARGLEYWRTVSSVFAARARGYSQVMAFADADIERYRWDAILDSASCTICRFMDKTTWMTADAAAQIERVMKLERPEDIVSASPWLSQGKNASGQDVIYLKDSQGRRREVAEVREAGAGKDKIGEYRQLMKQTDLVGYGIGTAPIHGRCRCTITTL